MERASQKEFGTFLDWSVSEVIEWLQSMSLHGNYARSFQVNNITGKSLLKFNQSTLDHLQVMDTDDRVTVLQSITGMRADLMTNNFSATAKLSRPNSAGSYRSTRNYSPTSVPSNSHSRNSTPVRDGAQLTHKCTRHSSCVTETRGLGIKQHLSRSLDRLVECGDLHTEEAFPTERCSRQPSTSSCGSRLVDILKEENVTLKKELDSYYQRVRRLHKIEQEVERIREAHKLLEESTTRREQIESAMRAKMEHQLKKLKERNFQLEMELQTTEPVIRMSDDKVKREIARRDSMIKKLIRQNKDSTSTREKLQKDLQHTKSALEDHKKEEGVVATHEHSSSVSSQAEELGSKMAEVYAKRIENLNRIVIEMQATSRKKEMIENKLRVQLRREIAKQSNGVDVELVAGDMVTVGSLEVARLEHRCLELTAERQMLLDAATVPRDMKIAWLKRTIAEQKDSIEELQQQKSKYLEQLHNANRKNTVLENRNAVLQLSIAEKDSLIQTLQQSYSEEEEMSLGGQTDTADTMPGGVVKTHEEDGASIGSTVTNSPKEGATVVGTLNLAVVTSISNQRRPGATVCSSSVPSSPATSHRLMEAWSPSGRGQFTKSCSLESTVTTATADSDWNKKTVGRSKIRSPNRKLPKTLSTDRSSPLAGAGVQQFYGNSREDAASRHAPWQV